MQPQMWETLGDVCGFWRDVSLQILEGVNIGKLMQYQRIKTRTLI